jgi:hypothetical protein
MKTWAPWKPQAVIGSVRRTAQRFSRMPLRAVAFVAPADVALARRDKQDLDFRRMQFE